MNVNVVKTQKQLKANIKTLSMMVERYVEIWYNRANYVVYLRTEET